MSSGTKHAKWFVVFRRVTVPKATIIGCNHRIEVLPVAKAQTAMKWAQDPRTLGMFCSLEAAMMFRRNFYRSWKERVVA